MLTPIIALAVITAGGSILAWALWLYRATSKDSEYEEFSRVMDDVVRDEHRRDIDDGSIIDTGNWSGYWLQASLKAGNKPDDKDKPGRNVAIAAIASMTVALLIYPGFWEISQAAAALVIYPIVVMACWKAFYSSQASKRMKTLERQLSQLISGMRANLQGNTTPGNALILASEGMPAPLGDELAIVRRDLEVNVSLHDALENLSKRVPSREIQFLVSAIQIANKSGENLSSQLTIIQRIIDSRSRVRMKLASAVASVQPVMLIAGLIIPGMFVFTYMSSQANREFWFTFMGMVSFGIVVVLYVGGLFMVKKMIERIEKT